MFNREYIDLKVKTVALETLGSVPDPLVHLAGVDRLVLTDQALEAIQTYVHNGGTILVETMGGRGDFARSIRKQLAEHFGRQPSRLKPGELFGGDGDRGKSLPKSVFRWYSVQRLGVRDEPRFTTLRVAGRPAILFSDADITLGLLGLRRWGIHGYRRGAAEALMTRLLLSVYSLQPRDTRDRPVTAQSPSSED